MSRPVVLCVDDEKSVLDSLREQLRRSAAVDCTVEVAESGGEALEVFEQLAEEAVDVPLVVSDHIMPGMRGVELLANIHARSPRTVKILLTGQADADAVGQAVNEAGLYRYIAKPWSEDDLVLTVREAMRRFFHEQKLDEQNAELTRLNGELETALLELARHRDRLRDEVVYLRGEARSDSGYAGIVGESEALQRVLAEVERVAATDATVLVLGESGTGKELVARAVHERSARRDRPLVRLNCAALPANLVESELFGHERGAFTGAVELRRGRFELADGGTLFLDEIGELPLEAQAKLLRVLQEGELERLGDATTRRVDVRVIAATNRDLRAEARAGRFREDLFYRLNVFPVHTPPLRDRREDIPALVHHFARRFAQRMGKSLVAVDRDALAALAAYDWPGNVRELSNVVERAVILMRSDTLRSFDVGDEPTAPPPRPSETPVRPLHEVERQLIRAALERCGGVIGGKRGAARMLDIPPSTLRERIKKYGLPR